MSEVFADRELAAWVTMIASSGDELDVQAMRAATAERARTRARGPEMDSVGDVAVGQLRARLYRPGAAALPVVLYLHGGGWTIGGIETHDRLCRRLADGSGAAVLSLDYRLAPEHPWPASVDDTVAALRWIADTGAAELGVMSGVVAVAGDSAGGLLAALSCLRVRDEYPAALPALQVLLNANTDLSGSQPSMREKASGFGLDADAVRFFNSQWVPDRDRWSDPAVSPLFAPDVSGLPPALIVAAEHDPLRDESAAYAERLSSAGVEVDYRCEPGLVHNFMMLDDISPACAAAADRVAADVRARLMVG
ncbi:MAG TPA: alpha/beta hydrolase [Solirubrobacteraceae bacterium]|jgi:acetyl esterase|nr:alpha/beta hydrolase [Solirubrobacteraceae bacterium]